MDTVARFGGDEFVVLLESVSSDREDAIRKAGWWRKRYVKTCRVPITLKTRNTAVHPVSVSACFMVATEQMDELIRHADAAMYQAKDAGGNTIRFHDPDSSVADRSAADGV